MNGSLRAELRNRHVSFAIDKKLSRLHSAEGQNSLRQKLDRLRSGSILRHGKLLQAKYNLIGIIINEQINKYVRHDPPAGHAVETLSDSGAPVDRSCVSLSIPVSTGDWTSDGTELLYGKVAFFSPSLTTMEIEVVGKNSKPIATVNVNSSSTIGDVKQQLYKAKKAPYVQRQNLRLEVKGKTLSDSETIGNLGLRAGSKLYYKDLGPQIGWKTVFLIEYAGPLLVYLWVYQRPWIFYGTVGNVTEPVVHWAAVCWTVHYAKRLLETLFVHRFSHATMPLRNLFKNCSYYWLFAMYVAYHVNHPLYTAPCQGLSYTGLAIFTICELGNLSIHLALRNLRPPGTTVRKIPVPTGNPLTALFNFVSCPNYTYEVGSWIGFTMMTKCLPAGLFAFAGAYQMTIWALGKHKLYKKEFSNYPKNRKAIIPFVL